MLVVLVVALQLLFLLPSGGSPRSPDAFLIPMRLSPSASPSSIASTLQPWTLQSSVGRLPAQARPPPDPAEVLQEGQEEKNEDMILSMTSDVTI